MFQTYAIINYYHLVEQEYMYVVVLEEALDTEHNMLILDL
jgi:hypothetical protein